jgi:hypothetical protein
MLPVGSEPLCLRIEPPEHLLQQLQREGAKEKELHDSHTIDTEL